ncbi:hypothetical protein EDB89DRAFT_1909628 [Lactarius sanguifluus]|nr:hypothetical protein EDB89DRAFT_1909628 [Lactarius sanguifluus]
MIDQLCVAQCDVAPRTKPTHCPPRTGAHIPADTPHDADVVSADLERAGAPVGQPAHERVEKRKGGDVLGGQVIRRIGEPAEGGAGGPVGAVDDEEQLVRGARQDARTMETKSKGYEHEHEEQKWTIQVKASEHTKIRGKGSRDIMTHDNSPPPSLTTGTMIRAATNGVLRVAEGLGERSPVHGSEFSPMGNTLKPPLTPYEPSRSPGPAHTPARTTAPGSASTVEQELDTITVAQLFILCCSPSDLIICVKTGARVSPCLPTSAHCRQLSWVIYLQLSKQLPSLQWIHVP